MSCISLTLQMSMNSSRPLPEEVDPMVEGPEGDSSAFPLEPNPLDPIPLDPKASPDLRLVVGLLEGLLDEVVFLDGRGSAKPEPPKLASGLEPEPLPSLGWSSFGIVRGNEYFGLASMPEGALAFGNSGENPCPKLIDPKAIAAATENVVQTKDLRSEA